MTRKRRTIGSAIPSYYRIRLVFVPSNYRRRRRRRAVTKFSLSWQQGGGGLEFVLGKLSHLVMRGCPGGAISGYSRGYKKEEGLNLFWKIIVPGDEGVEAGSRLAEDEGETRRMLF